MKPVKRPWVDKRTPKHKREDALRRRMWYLATKLAELHELEPMLECGAPEGSHTPMFWVKESAKCSGDQI